MICPATDPRCQHTRGSDVRNYGCRCPAAKADREHRRKKGHLLPPTFVDATGARRRLRALMAIGHSQNDLNVALGRKPSGSVGPALWSDDRHRITRTLDQRVREVYDRLWDVPGSGPRADLVRARAAARGWAPPLFWASDDELDDPTFTPVYEPYQPPTAAELRAEREEQIRDLTARGYSAADIAERLGVSERTVVRHRVEQQEAA